MKAILWNIVAAIVIILATILAIIFVPDSWPGWSTLAIIIVAFALLTWVFIIPWIKWYTTTFTVTSRRIITRTGIFTKRGHDIPLYRISNVSYERDLIDRFFKCGTIVLETSADNPLYLHDIPNAEAVHVELTELLFHTHQGNDPGDI